MFVYDDDSTRTNRAALDVLVVLIASYFYVKIDESAPPNRLGEIYSETADDITNQPAITTLECYVDGKTLCF